MALRMIGLALVLAALWVGTTAHAGNMRNARKQVESSLLVSGTITIAPDGSVKAHALEPSAPLGDTLTAFLDNAIGRWRFEPVVVDGSVVTAKVPMSLRLIAQPADDGKVNISIASTYFGNGQERADSEDVRSVKLTPPTYPKRAMHMGGKGTVYLIVQVGRDGRVINVGAEQVNLRVLGNESEMAMLRKQLTDASLRAARGWTFNPPTTGIESIKDTWLVRVPVDFVLSDLGQKKPLKGTWDSYVPGPRNTDMPWAREELQTAGSPDAVPDSGVFPLRQGAKLLTPPAT